MPPQGLSFAAVFLFVMMALAVVVTVGVAINDGAVEKHRQHLLHRKLGRASMDTNAQLVQQIDSTLAYYATKHIGATLFGQEPRHGTVLMFGRLQHLLVNNFSVFYINNSDLRRFGKDSTFAANSTTTALPKTPLHRPHSQCIHGVPHPYRHL